MFTLFSTSLTANLIHDNFDSNEATYYSVFHFTSFYFIIFILLLSPPPFIFNLQAHQINRLLNSIFGRANLNLIVTGIRDKITDGLTCRGVQTIVSIGRNKKLSKGTLSKLIAITCKDLRVETEKVCNGIGQMFAPPVKFILENTKLSNKEISAVVLGHKCLSDEDWAKYQSLNWKIFIPPVRGSNSNVNECNKSFPSENEKGDIITKSNELQDTSFKFVHFTDIHLDLEYSVGAEVNCDEPVCCRADVSNVAKGSKSMKSRKWGETEGYCDSPMDLVEESLRHIGQTVERSNGSIKYAIWTGKWAGCICRRSSVTHFSPLPSPTLLPCGFLCLPNFSRATRGEDENGKLTTKYCVLFQVI